MVEIWYAILAFTLTIYLVLDGRNFGGRCAAYAGGEDGRRAAAGDRRDRPAVVVARGVAGGGGRRAVRGVSAGSGGCVHGILSGAVSGAVVLILRGIALEVGGHIGDPLWQEFWDFIFTVSSTTLAVLFGAALGNVVRGVPLDASGEFEMAFFTNLGVRGHVGLLDWYTVSMGVFVLIILGGHGATYLTLKTEGAVHDRAERIARRLWAAACPGFVAIAIETWWVRPELVSGVLHRPLAVLAAMVALAGAVTILSGIRGHDERRAFAGSWLVITGLLSAGAAVMYPIVLNSTLGTEHSLTAYNSSASREGLLVGMVWWPIAFRAGAGILLFHRPQVSWQGKAGGGHPGILLRSRRRMGLAKLGGI